MPWLGLGVFQIGSDAETASVVRKAVELGYRSIDTAALYGNERGVGEGVRTCGVSREKIFVTTKVWTSDIRNGRIAEAFDASMEKLDLDYVDLYLLHWPVKGHLVPAWREMEKLLRGGRVKAIGVSNYMIPHLEGMLASAEVVPAVNQVEFHPYLQNRALQEYCRKKHIQLEAWSPLMQAGAILKDKVMAEIAKRHGKSVAQIILRWDLQQGVMPIPKTTHEARLRENAALFDFELSPDEVKAITALERNERCGDDPMNFSF